MFQRLGYINDQLYEVELGKSEIEQNETINVGFSYPAVYEKDNARAAA